MISSFPFCFIKQTPRGIIIHANAYCEGYSVVHWQKQGDTTHLHSYALSGEEEELTGFDEGPGTYDFWLSASYTRTTSKVSQFITLESARSALVRVSNYIKTPVDGNFIEDEVQATIKSLPVSPTSYASCLFDRLYAIKNPLVNEKRSYAQLISIFERNYNVITNQMNKDIMGGFSIDYEEQTIDLTKTFADSVELYVYTSGCEEFVKQIKADRLAPTRLNFMQNQVYLIRIYSGVDLLCQLIHCQLDDGLQAYLRENKLESQTQSDDIMISDSVIKHANIELSEEELQDIKEERAGEPLDVIIPRPQVTLSDNLIILNIEEYPLLKAMNKTFNVSYRERDLIGDETFDSTITIPSDRFNMLAKENCLETEVIFYIQDSNGNKISRTQCLSIEGDKSEYVEKIRRIELMEYIESLSKAISKRSDLIDTMPVVNNAFSAVYADIDTNVDNVVWRLLCRIVMVDGLPTKRNKLMFFIISHWFDRFNYDTTFFNGYIWEDVNTGRLSWPTRKKPYTLVTATFNAGDEDVHFTYHQGTEKESADAYINMNDFYIMFAIDNENYHKSGFVFASTVLNRNCQWTNLLPYGIKPLE